MEPQELKPLEYSKPVCWCESTGSYTNPQGQKLELQVRGKDVERVEEYMKAVRISFEVLPEQEERQKNEEPSEEQYDKYKSLIDEEFKKIELHPELDLEIDLDVLETPGMELPYELNVIIDPPIAGGATDSYKTKKKAKEIKVTLKASVSGGVYGVLSGGGISPVTGQADTYQPDPPKDSAKYSGEASAETAADFYFTVTGVKSNNTYTYSSSTKLIRT